MKRFAGLIVSVGMLAGCATPAEQTPTTSPSSTTTMTTTTTPEPEPDPAQVRQQVASMLMPGVVSYDDAKAKLEAGVGGIFITSWADPNLLTEPGRDIHALRAEIGRPFDVAIDFEGGRVQRFSHILGDHPAPRDLAATMSMEEVEAKAQEIGQSLSAHGITVDFAPVIDVDGGGLEVVGDRSFSQDPRLAGDYGAAFARGLQRAGVHPVFKHYPGHGRASGDTHLGEAITPPLPELMGHDLIPFEEAFVQAPGAAVMVGHMVVPGLGDGITPASLNNHAYGLLRNHHKFDGMAYTDDLTGMAAISNTMSIEQAVPKALAAGADQALWSSASDINAVIDACVHAVETGEIHPYRLQSGAQRVAHRLDSMQ
ncbi:glycoside hydrolase family 3 N-terminal domain-containing protein [Corynebacterium ammoniagenes]|nr:glycoside hydrolase family 3 N-terminal domain-containing protein [Corynebacterium ammoniagenes]APT83526.1 beta-N-acetylglucosaminidase [Corynebacterium ammoniagenes DSM 20306]AQS74524.1 beta-N-acetylglucosaminidase [Corynebacterium ammoniagenes]NMF32081.1 glycoside hydrolase family 3 protein [Corynebacterium ammoniagenes]